MSAPPQDNLRLAIVTILFTVFILSLGDALIKQLSSELTLWQIFLVRSLVVVPALVRLVKLREPNTPLLPQRLGWTLVRSLMLTIMWLAYYIALPHVVLSVAAAMFYTLPSSRRFSSEIKWDSRAGWPF